MYSATSDHHVPNPVVTANESSTVLLECNAVGTPPPTISWFKDSVHLPSSSLPRTTIAATHSLVVTGVLLIDAECMYMSLLAILRN